MYILNEPKSKDRSSIDDSPLADSIDIILTLNKIMSSLIMGTLKIDKGIIELIFPSQYQGN